MGSVVVASVAVVTAGEDTVAAVMGEAVWVAAVTAEVVVAG